MARNSKTRKREITSSQRKMPSKARLEIKIISTSYPISTISLPVASILEREIEMENAAEAFDLPEERWNGSLLYELHKKRECTLDPEQTCEEEYCHIVTWKPWMTKIIEDFYKTGELHVPDDCQGSDLLLALEFFAILYQPDQLIFQSFATYNRVKVWSQYLTCRTTLLEWVARRLHAQPQTPAFRFATRPVSTSESWIEFGRKRVPIFEGGMPDEVCQNLGKRNSAEIVHEFFGKGEVADAMRADFCMYAFNALANIEAYFTVEAVTVHCSDKTKHDEYRAILIITRTKASRVLPKQPTGTPMSDSKPNLANRKASPGDEKPSKVQPNHLDESNMEVPGEAIPGLRGLSENSPRGVAEIYNDVHEQTQSTIGKTQSTKHVSTANRHSNQSTSKQQSTYTMPATPSAPVLAENLPMIVHDRPFDEERSGAFPFSVINEDGFKTVASGLSESHYHYEESEVNVHDVSDRMKELLRSHEDKNNEKINPLNVTTETEDTQDSYMNGFAGWLFGACGDMTCGLPGCEIEFRTSGSKARGDDVRRDPVPLATPEASPVPKGDVPRQSAKSEPPERVSVQPATNGKKAAPPKPRVTKSQEKQLHRLREASGHHVSIPSPERPPTYQSRYEDDFRREEQRRAAVSPKAMVKNRMQWSEKELDDRNKERAVAFSDDLTGAQSVMRDFDQSHTRYCGQSFFRKKPTATSKKDVTDEHGVAESKKGIRKLMCKLPSQL